MKRFQRHCLSMIAIVLTSLCMIAESYAQAPSVRVPRPSQKASVMQTVGVTDVTITYSRPSVRGRKIWGDAPPGADQTSTATLDDQNKRPKDAVIVPYGHVWRTGANEATTFAVTDDVLINGQKLAAGIYSLHTIPNRNEWIVIFNSNAGQWGSFFYEDTKDVLRITVKPESFDENQEWLLYSIPVVTSNSAQVMIRWEKLGVSFNVEIPNVDAMMRARAEALAVANPGDSSIALAVGNYYANDGKFDEARLWIERSLKTKKTFQNLQAKARLLVATGHKDEALIVAEQAIQVGKADKNDTSRFEKWLADLKSK